jgi:tetratricopeptide (TPR) repeat protein
MKLISIVFVTLFAFIPLTGCSSPEEKAAAHIANADELFANDQLEKARIEYKNALQLNQNLPDAWYGLAQIHERNQQWTKAYGILTKIRDSNPQHMDGRILLAKILLASKQFDQALEDANDILELAPDDARAHSIMAAVQFRLGNIEAAQQSVEHALVLDPGSQEAILVQASMLISKEKYKESLGILDAALQANPDVVAFYLTKLKIYGELGDQPAVEQTYKTLIQKFPENISFRLALVRLHIRNDNIDQAELLLQQIVEENPDKVEEKVRLVDFKNQYRSIDDSIKLVKAYIEQDQTEHQFKFTLGELFLRNNQPDEAIAIYQGIVTEDGLQPNGLKARIQLALIYLQTGKEAESRSLVDEVLAYDKNNEIALLLRARFNLAEARYDEAITNLRTVLRDNPTSMQALGLIGRAHTEMGATNLANESYAKALRVNPANSLIANSLARNLLKSDNSAQADEILLKSIENGNRSVEALLLLVQVKLNLKQWEQADQLAKILDSIEGEEALTQQVLGLVYQSRELQGESIEAFKRAHELEPDAYEPVMAVVQAYLKNDKVDEARAFLHSVVAQNSNNATAHQLLAQLSLHENDLPTAIGHLEQVINADPKLETPYRSLASIYTRDNKLEEAENILQQGLLEMPGNVVLSVDLGLVFERKKDFEKAIELYEAVLQVNPDIIIARNNLASLLTDQREDQVSHDRARQAAATLRNSKVPQFRDTYAWASVRSGLFLAEAVVILEGIVKENETVGAYHYHLGEAYRKSGTTYKARNSLRKAISLEMPGSPVTINAKKSLTLMSQ